MKAPSLKAGPALKADRTPSVLQDAVEATYMAIRTAILDGTYASGQHLTGAMLAASIGVSRTPVREALRRLDAEGLVQVVPNQGAYVIGWTSADVAQIYGLRAVLETYATELATPALSHAQIDEIAALADLTFALAERQPAGFYQAFADANVSLHTLIIHAAATPRLCAMIAGLVEWPTMLRTLRLYSRDELVRSAGHHRELALAFRARDPIWASAVMRSHLLAARRAVLEE